MRETQAEAGLDWPTGPGCWFRGETPVIVTDLAGTLMATFASGHVCTVAGLTRGGWLKATPADDRNMKSAGLRMNMESIVRHIISPVLGIPTCYDNHCHDAARIAVAETESRLRCLYEAHSESIRTLGAENERLKGALTESIEVLERVPVDLAISSDARRQVVENRLVLNATSSTQGGQP